MISLNLNIDTVNIKISYTMAAPEKQSCVITPTFDYHDYWLFVKTAKLHFWKKRLQVKPKFKQRMHVTATQTSQFKI